MVHKGRGVGLEGLHAIQFGRTFEGEHGGVNLPVKFVGVYGKCMTVGVCPIGDFNWIIKAIVSRGGGIY